MRCIVKLLVALGWASQVLIAFADTENQPPDDNPEAMEQIIVTGSRIPRRDFFSTSPIVTVDRAEIELTGTSEIKNLLNRLPQIDPARDAGTSNAFAGESFVNLRALGSNRTLVLLNGRRFPSQGRDGSVDLNALPPVMIEKIEIITGGASAVYGSDAMAGAVNFVLRTDFVGLETKLQYDQTSRGDAEKHNLDLVYGTPFARGRGNLVVHADYFKREKLFQDARSFSKNRITSNDSTGELIVFNSFASPASSIAGVGPFYTFEPDGAPRLFVEPDDRFSLAPFNPLLAPMERYSANAFGHFDIDDSRRLRFELNYARSLPASLVADEFFDFVDINVDRPDLASEFRDLLASDADPDGDGIASIFLARTFSPERGTGRVDYTSEFARGLIGIEGGLDRSWYWRVDASYAENERDSDARNDISIGRLRQGLLVDPATGDCVDPGRNCVPVNPFGAGNLSPEAARFITLPDSALTERSTETFLTAEVRGTPLQYGQGELELAAGAEYRRFSFENSFPNDSLQSGDSLFFGTGVNPIDGTISVREVFVESRIPLLAGLSWANYFGLDLGARVSDYNILDEAVWTWKLGAEWQLSEQLRVRIMEQRAIRAPSMADLFQGVNFAFTDFDFGPAFDQCSASQDPIGNGLSEVCIAQGLTADQLGVFEAGLFPVAVSRASNPKAEPEEADTLSFGIVWQTERLGGLSASVDYFRIEIKDALATADHMDLARLCFLSRDPNAPACQTLTRAPSGDIESAQITVINSALATVEGIDLALDLDWQIEGPAWLGRGANLALSMLATHYLEAGSQGSVLLPFLDCAGKFGGFCGLAAYQGAVPDWRATARLTYQREPFSASLRWSYIGELTNAEAELRQINNLPPPVLAVPTVSAVDYFDVTFAWRVGESLSLNFGIENLLDEDPPLLGSAAREANTDPNTYDILGRRFFLSAKLSY